MQIYLVGADLEENLALGLLAAVVEQSGHEPHVVSWSGPEDTPHKAALVAKASPALVGLSIQFQHRADEMLAFTRALRAAGYAGHVTVGGQFPSVAYDEVLEGGHGVDSVVLYDGEHTLAELLAALEQHTPIEHVAGLVLPGAEGGTVRTADRRLIDDLDALPFPKRYRPHSRHLGIPFIPILGSRGCWGECAFCSIMAVYREARRHGGGRLLRLRGVDDIAAEMALSWHDAGGRAIFCFHDDNFLLPRPEASVARLRALRRRLDEYGVGEIGLVGKCRPETLSATLAGELAELGVIRLYVGVENASVAGAAHLGRAVQQRAVHTALEACREAGIFACYNLLVFEPEATVADVRENLRFIREHADHPVNFCRAEPYIGTPLERATTGAARVTGSDLGWNYRIRDDATELLYRVCSAVFAERNFAPNGVANRTMGLGYAAKLLETFHGGDGEAAALARRARRLSRCITLDAADYLEKAIRLVDGDPLADSDRIERESALLGLEVAAADSIWHRQLDELVTELDAFVAQPRPAVPPPQPTARLLTLKRTVALGLSVAAVFAGCDCSESTAVDPAPGGFGGGGSGAGMTGDPAPGGFGGGVVDPAPGGFGGGVVDPAPGGFGGVGGSGGMSGDPAPGGFGGAASTGGAHGMPGPQNRPSAVPTAPGDRHEIPESRHALVDHWRDGLPGRAKRTADLALFAPPEPSLRAKRCGDAIEVTLEAAALPVTTRWEADGPLVVRGTSCTWRPCSPSERLRVAVRSRGGIAVLTLRADAAERTG